ncbi:MAG: glycosyltransferase [Gemmatimonadota bacterium]|nr:glycosyltransferase [Gemmatimonadota bacterium]
MPRRVLHLIDTGGPGGAETVFMEVAEGLAGRGWEPVPVVPVIDWLHRALADRGLDPVVLEGTGSFDLGFLRRLVSLARSERIDLIHTHLLGSAVYGGLAGRLLAVPVVSTLHGHTDLDERESYRLAKRRVIDGRSTSLVFVSRALRDHFLSGRPLRRAEARVVHNGIALDRCPPIRNPSLRPELGAGGNEVLVGAIGNVREPKAYDVLLRSAAEVVGCRSDVRFVVVGEASGDLYERLLEQRSALGLEETLRFVGFRDDVTAVLQALDVYVSSSTHEGFSLTTLHAIACGVPVVATRSGGPSEIVEDGVSGLLAEPGDAEGLATCLDAVLSGRLTGGTDPRVADRRRLADVGRFSTEAMVSGYEAIYHGALGIPASPAADSRAPQALAHGR